MEFTNVKVPEPVSGVAPWEDPAWVADADAWIDDACVRSGLSRTGPATVRARMYSLVARVPVDQGTVWFKASPAAEPALLGALARWRPGFFTAPLAADLERGWILLADGGETLRDRDSRDPDQHAWPVMLMRYAGLQEDMTRRLDDLLALGLPDLRPENAPAEFERLIGTGASPELRALTPRVEEWCAELAGLGIPASLDHADVHPGNVFAEAGVPFDWGDAVVGHPFCSLWVTLRQAAWQAGVAPRSARVGALAENYFEPWRMAGHSRNAIYRSLHLALKIAPLTRALAHVRTFDCFRGHPVPAAAAARTLSAMLLPDPLDSDQ